MSQSKTTVKPSSEISRGMVLLLAAACGLSVANLYYAQPVLDAVAKTYFDQFGDRRPGGDPEPDRLRAGPGPAGAGRRPGGAAAACSYPSLVIGAGALVVSALAPDIEVLIAVALLVGAGSVMAQVLIPMAASLASEERRGQVVGTVMSGLLLGILLARTVSGVVARPVQLAGGLRHGRRADGGPGPGAGAKLPGRKRAGPDQVRQPAETTVGLLWDERILHRRAWFGALGFAAFSVFWTTMAFLLPGAPYHDGD